MATDLPEGKIILADASIITSRSGDRLHSVIGKQTTTNEISVNPAVSQEINKKSFESFLHTITYDTMHLDPKKADGKLNPRELMAAAKKIGYHNDVFAETENGEFIKLDNKFKKALKDYADKKDISVKFSDVNLSQNLTPTIFESSKSNHYTLSK